MTQFLIFADNKEKMQEDDGTPALLLDNRNGQSLDHLELAEIQIDRPKSEAKTFQAFEKILVLLTDYERVSLNFLLGEKYLSPPTDLLKEALAISGNLKAIREVFDQDKNDEALLQFEAQNPHHSVNVNLLRKKLFILAENLNPKDTQEIIYKLADGNFELVDQQIELYFESLIKLGELSLNNCERLRQVLVDLKLTELYKIFSSIKFFLCFMIR